MAEIKKILSLVAISLQCGGSKLEIDDDIIVEISVSKSVNKISRANVRLTFANLPLEEAYKFTEKENLKPGGDISIQIGYQEETIEEIFKGVIKSHKLSRDEDRRISLEMECAHKSLLLGTIRKNGIFQGKDSDIIKKIIASSGLSANVSTGGTIHKEMVQYYCSDWDFILSRAEACGMIVLTNDDKIKIDKPDLSKSPAFEVSDQDGLLSFSASVDGENQFKSVEAQTWDSATQKNIKVTSGSISSSLGGSITTDSLASTFNKKNYFLQTNANMPNDELKAWAESKLAYSKISRISGTAVVQGTAKANPGEIVKISGISKLFNGNAFIGSVEQRITQEKWESELELGGDFSGYTEYTSNIEMPHGSGLIPPASGIQIAKVVEVGNDTDGNFRIKIKLTSMIDKSETIMARLSNLYASESCGIVFLPEVDDEVIVAFINNDPRNAVILGSVFSSKRAMPVTPDKKNEIKSIVTKSKMKVTFDEKNKIITIETPGGNKFILDDKAKKIELADSNRNKIMMNSSGITLDSGKDVKISAKGQITINAMMGAKIEAKTTLDLNATSIKIDAKAALEAKANGMAKLQSSGILTIQGTLVKIN